MIAFTVPGPPIPLARARVFVRSNGKIGSANPARSTGYKQKVALYFNASKRSIDWPLDGRFTMSIKVYWPDARRRDLSNLAKGVEDSLIGLAYNDDSQIDEIHLFGTIDRERPRIEVRIERKVKVAA